MKKGLLILSILPLVASLANSPEFGNPTLFALFFYMLFSTIVGLIVFLMDSFYLKRQFKLPVHIWFFLLFSLYIILHGFFTDTIGLVHYFWMSNALLLLAYHRIFLKIPDYFVKFIYIGITILALFESAVVLLQFFNFLPSKNELFPCTGTWINPNVTAIFISLSLFAVFQVVERLRNSVLKAGIVFILLLSILLLYSRTAYLVGLLFTAAYYWKFFKHIQFKKIRFSLSNVGITVLLIICGTMFLAPFFNKIESLRSRVHIWENSINLAEGRPISGYGFGRFEKEYNLFVASQENEKNSHINMAYNDFLELFVEGGIIATSFWIIFLLSFIRFCFRGNKSLLPGIAMVIIQLTNFGFQAIPVMAIFMVYVAVGSESITKEKSIESFNILPGIIKNLRITSALLVGITIFVFLRLIIYTGAYYEQNKLRTEIRHPLVILSLQKLEKLLSFSSNYHENFGDVFMAKKKFGLAIKQYRKALQTCSRPDVFAKSGYCFLMIGQFDSCEHYYQYVQNIEPRKIIPRMALLKLYEQRKDTQKILFKINEIMNLPIRIASKKAIEIKEYARVRLKQIDSIRGIEVYAEKK